MPENDLFRRSLDAGLAFTELTRKRAEKMVKDLVKSGEVSRDQATARVEELLDRSRQNTEALIAIVRKEIDDRIAQLNLASLEDLSALAARFGISVTTTSGSGGGATQTSAPKQFAVKATDAARPAAKRAATTAKKTTKAAGTAGRSTATAKRGAATTAAKTAAAAKTSTAKTGAAARAGAAKTASTAKAGAAKTVKSVKASAATKA